MCCDAPSAPQVDPRQGEALNKQADTANRMVEHTIESDKLNRERLLRLDEQQKPLIEQYYQNQTKQEARADSAYKRYEEIGLPAMNRMISDANSFDSEANLAEIRGRAASDVEQAFASRRDDTMRNMRRMGVDPVNGRSMAAMGDMDARAGLAKITAMNTAADGRTVQGMQLRQQAGNLVNGMSAQSLNLSQAGMQAGSAATATGNASFGNALGAQNAFNSGMQGAGGIYGSTANGFGNIYNQQLAGAQFDAQNSTGAAIGQLGGMAINAYAASKMSDKRVKTNIKQIGKTNSGLNIYSYNYVWDLSTTHVGVIAQELQLVKPEAVITGEDGILRVNYSMVD